MNRSSLRLCIALTVAGSAALLACSIPSGADSDEGVAQTTQGLRKCTGVCDDGPADPAPPKPTPTTTVTPPPPPPPPPPTNAWLPPTGSSGSVFVMDYTFTCNDTTHQLAYWTTGPNGTIVPSVDPVCWIITDCHPVVQATARVISSSGSPPPPQTGPICNGYTLVSQSYCSRGLRMACDWVYGTCSCVP